MMTLIRMNKVHEDSETLWIDAIVLGAGQKLPIKNWQGFEVATIEEDGTITSKGRKVKI